MLLTKTVEHESITLDNTSARTEASSSSSLCLLRNERPRFLQLKYFRKTSPLELIGSIPTNCHELLRKVCFSSNLPIRDLYASSYPQTILMFTAFQDLNLIRTHSVTTPPLPPPPQNTFLGVRALRFPVACPPRHPSCFPLTQLFPLRAPDGGRGRSHHQTVIKIIDGIENDETRPGWTTVPVTEV